MSSPCFLYIIYLELCFFARLLRDDNGSDQMAICTKWCSYSTGPNLSLFTGFWSSNNRVEKCPLWKCTVLIKARLLEHPFWAGLILVNCPSIPYLSHVVMIRRGAFGLLCTVAFLASHCIGLLETMTSDEFEKLLCRSRACKCLACRSLIAVFLVNLHLWSAVQGKEHS